jgi:hypothetical protein
VQRPLAQCAARFQVSATARSAEIKHRSRSPSSVIRNGAASVGRAELAHPLPCPQRSQERNQWRPGTRGIQHPPPNPSPPSSSRHSAPGRTARHGPHGTARAARHGTGRTARFGTRGRAGLPARAAAAAPHHEPRNRPTGRRTRPCSRGSAAHKPALAQTHAVQRARARAARCGRGAAPRRRLDSPLAPAGDLSMKICPRRKNVSAWPSLARGGPCFWPRGACDRAAGGEAAHPHAARGGGGGAPLPPAPRAPPRVPREGRGTPGRPAPPRQPAGRQPAGPLCGSRHGQRPGRRGT